MNPDAKCEDCQYWKEMSFTLVDTGGAKDGQETNIKFGQCRFNAPVHNLIDRESKFPFTASDDWCGKFESKTQRRESTQHFGTGWGDTRESTGPK